MSEAHVEASATPAAPAADAGKKGDKKGGKKEAKAPAPKADDAPAAESQAALQEDLVGTKFTGGEGT